MALHFIQLYNVDEKLIRLKASGRFSKQKTKYVENVDCFAEIKSVSATLGYIWINQNRVFVLGTYF